MKSAMGLKFNSKRETRYNHKDDCKIPNIHTFIKKSPRLKKEAAEMPFT